MIARSLRYFIEGTLAVFYGQAVIQFLKHNGLKILGVAAALCLVGIAVYLIRNRLRARRGELAAETASGNSETLTESESAETSASSNGVP